jgi:hypothetical protein
MLLLSQAMSSSTSKVACLGRLISVCTSYVLPSTCTRLVLVRSCISASACTCTYVPLCLCDYVYRIWLESSTYSRFLRVRNYDTSSKYSNFELTASGGVIAQNSFHSFGEIQDRQEQTELLTSQNLI